MMLKLIRDLPTDMLGIEDAGKVTHEDYRKILIPRAEAMMAGGPIRMLYVAGKDFAGYELEALSDDSTFGLKHWRQLRDIAVVTDRAMLRAAITMFCPFFPSEIRLFRLADLAAAKV